MIEYPNIDPVAISLGPVKVHWYGLMYLFGFAGIWFLGRHRANSEMSPIKPEAMDDLVFYGAMGAILGGRIGYIIFYNFSQFIADPVVLFKVWQGGMSFHGGMLGVFVAMWIYGKHFQLTMFQLTDFIAPMAPIGLFTGRIGNFINGELWGQTSDVPWAMIFPTGGPLPRHPSQLYEAFLEGIVLFIILWIFSSKPRPVMSVTGMSILWYGIFRFCVEFIRMPDAHIGYLALDWVTMGQLLSTPMIVIGALLIFFAYKKTTCSNT